jgi:tetratricopeptide (TPR) repeat protein
MQSLRSIGLMLVSIVVVSGVQPGLLWGQRLSPDHTVQLYQQLLQRNPLDSTAYYRLGDAYIQKARETGDITYLNLAEQALRKAVDITPQHSGAARHLAYALYTRHAFEEAAIQAAKAVELDPSDSHAYGILGDAYLEVGKYAEAQQAYERMIQLQGDLYSYSRLSGLKSLKGDTHGAMADLEQAIEAGRAHSRPSESIAWALWQLGNEHFALGHLPEAESKYLQALNTFPNYYRASAGLAQVRAAQQRYAEAIALYQKAIAVIPLPDYAAALGDVYAKMGRVEDAQKQYDLVAYIGYLNTLNRVLYNRELAYFYADHDIELQEALDLAKKELEVRRDIYAYDVLAWTLHKNGNPHEALAAMTEALKMETKDARLFFHAGMIYHHLGEPDRAREYLQRALATNPYFHPLYADVADRTLKELKRDVDLAATQEESDAP